MNNSIDLLKITKTLQLTSYVRFGACQECSEILPDALDEVSNHYLHKHSYKLLFIGSETGRDNDNNLITHTIMFLGQV